MADTPAGAPQRRDGTVEEALANGRALLARAPRMALAQAQAILAQNRADDDALRLAAAAHRALGETKHAVDAEMAAIRASERDSLLVAAARALDQKDFAEASRLAAERVRSAPGDLGGLTLSAESAIAMGLPDKGEPLLREVLERAPPFAPARELLLNALVLLDRMTEARVMLQDMAASDVQASVTHLRLLSRIETGLGNYDAAAILIERILGQLDARPDDWIDYGDSLRFGGRKQDAAAAYRQALAKDPGFGRAWWSLADLDPANIVDEDVAKMEQALARARDPEHIGNLAFALGIVFDARKLPDKAFPHFYKGNALRRQAQPYDAGETSRQVDRYLAALSPVTIPALSNASFDGPTPIFIVGMPRSGSTLVERILSRHSRIEGLGELPVVPHMVQRLARNQEAEWLEDAIGSLPAHELQRLGQWYIERASEHRRTDKPFFIDKLHMNWRHLALILRMLPQARIVDIRRNPMDCCWSNYKTLFARGHPAASDLGDIGHFYTDYVRFTDQLREWAPSRIHLLHYEELVENIALQVGGLFEAIGLPFEEDCLAFHLSSDPVATASSEQVRRPLNRDGLGTWRPYEPWLAPLKQALGSPSDGFA